MLVLLRSGRRLEIAGHHSVFTPLGNYAEGDPVDPFTVSFECQKAASYIRGGVSIIVDNVVEVVQQVISPWAGGCDFPKVDLKGHENPTVFRPASAEAYRRAVRLPAARPSCQETQGV